MQAIILQNIDKFIQVLDMFLFSLFIILGLLVFFRMTFLAFVSAALYLPHDSYVQRDCGECGLLPVSSPGK